MVNVRNPEEAMIVFKHAGDRGDIIYYLPAVKWVCEQRNDKALFLIESAPYTREQLTPDKWNGIDAIIRAQSYILDVQAFRGQKVDFNGNDFRPLMQRSLVPHRVTPEAKQTCLSDWMLDAHKIPRTAKNDAWLSLHDLNRVAPIVINRSGPGRSKLIYQNPDFPWHEAWRKYKDYAVFIGTPIEHEVFCKVNGEVPFYPTPDLYQAARVITGCELFIGNQSCCHAIAEGLKKNIILEVWRDGPNCLHYRPGVVHGWDHSVGLPDIIFGEPPQ